MEMCPWCRKPLVMHGLDEARRCVFSLEWETRNELQEMAREQERQMLLKRLRERTTNALAR